MYCEKCGGRNNETAKFCVQCGADLEKQKIIVEESKNMIPVQVKPTENTSDGKATASLVLGILSFVLPCLGFITSIVGLCLGIASKERSGKRTAGIVLNIIALAIYVIFFLLPVLFGAAWPGVQESINNQWENISTSAFIVI